MALQQAVKMTGSGDWSRLPFFLSKFHSLSFAPTLNCHHLVAEGRASDQES